MYKKVIVGSVFVLIVGGSLAFCKKTDAEILTKVGRTASNQVMAAMPERSAVAGPLAQMTAPDLSGPADRVRVRLKTDTAVSTLNLNVTADGDVVKLSGKADTSGQRERAVQLAQTTTGVAKVEHEIAVPEGK